MLSTICSSGPRRVTPGITCTSAAERQRRHRERRGRGVFVVPIEVTGAMITALVDQGSVDEANSSDLDCIRMAIAAAARRDLDLD